MADGLHRTPEAVFSRFHMVAPGNNDDEKIYDCVYLTVRKSRLINFTFEYGDQEHMVEGRPVQEKILNSLVFDEK